MHRARLESSIGPDANRDGTLADFVMPAQRKKRSAIKILPNYKLALLVMITQNLN
jgi:hypothetical protein